MRFWYGGKEQECRYKVLSTWEGYGIAGERLGETAAAEGLFCTKQEARRFARACTRAQLEPCHLRDAAEDWAALIK